MLRLLLAAALILSSTASCGVVRNTAGAIGLGQASATRSRVEEDGVRYRARATASRQNPRDFTVTVSPFAANPEGAVEAGRYQATRYCLLTFGGSDTEWEIGPDTPLEELPVDGDDLTLTGRCTQK